MSRNDHWLAFLLVAVLTLIYAPTVRFGYITLDDRFFHIETPQLHGGINASTLHWALTDTAGNYWHPTWNLVNLVAFTAFGPHAGPQHVVNTVLYGAMSAGLFYTLRATTLRAAVAFVAAALWAWHPLHVENVNWLTERAGLLAAGFCIATVAAYLAYGRRPSAWRYALVALCLFLAMGAKPIYAALPVALLALDLWPLDREGRVTFDPPTQNRIAAAFGKAATELGLPIRWGGRFHGFKDRDRSHFELVPR